jgi:dynactin complex subunit
MQNKENSNPNSIPKDRNPKINKINTEVEEIGKKFCYQCLEYSWGKDWSKKHEEHKVGIFSTAV